MPFDQMPGDLAPPSTFQDLSCPEQLVLWSIRLWSHGNRTGACVLPTLCCTFAKAGAAGAIPPLDRLMVSLTMSRRKILQIRPVCCHGITADEAAMLTLVAGLGRGKEARAVAILNQWVRSDLTQKCLEPAARFADYLTRAGLDLPLRQWRYDQMPKSAGRIEPDPLAPVTTSQTIH